MIDNPAKRKHPESEAGRSTDDLQTKRVKTAPKKTKTSPRSPRPGTSSMGPPPLPAARLSQNSGNKGPLKKTQSSIRPKYKTPVPSHLQQLSPSSVRLPAHSAGSSSFITTPVILSQTTFAPPARPLDARSNGSVAINYVAKLQGPPWLPPATRPQGPKKHSDPGISSGACLYPKRRETTGFSNLQENTKKEPPPPRREMIKTPSAADPTPNVYQFHASKSLGEGNWPVISLGQQGPLPRWRLWLHKPDLPLGKDLQLDLIRTHQNRTVIRGLNHDSKPKSNDPTIGLGALHWEFEPGPAAGWGGLSGEQLYEYAYKCLEDALNDYTSRHQIREVLRRANLPAIAHVEDPLSPLPSPPAVTHFGPEAGVARWPKIPAPISGEIKTFFGNRYWRPSMAVRPGKRGRSNMDFLVTRMRRHLRGTLSPPGVTSHSLDPVDSAPDPPAPGLNNTTYYSKGLITGAGVGHEGKDGPIGEFNYLSFP
ncbi:hypothetical protein N7520_008570 [Penicillium odoratum]|uniref:uncharacterized protein n=1 Tax=Penicillium odoratum TaxID=1167516 RepID=UPI002546EBC1|nr:uncharacterized protein N7520_008570 [Penicillium odoratum]KAJ5751653.1 hypothetical protein N7520_008570 [Penicillium odoratum]